MRKILKNILLIILVVLLAFMITGCKSKEETEVKNEEAKVESVTPVFYKITSDKNNSTIYLLGSIHAAEDSIYPLNETIMSAYNSSDYLAVEVDIVETQKDMSVQLDLAQKMLYENGTKIKDELGEELYTKMVEVLREKKLYSGIYDVYKPAFFESLLETTIIKDSGLDSSAGVDMHFLNLAKENQKDILEIETADFQFDLLLNNPIELDKLMILSMVYCYDENVSYMKELYENWKKGDTSLIEKENYVYGEIDLPDEINEQDFEAQVKELMEEYNKKMITDRNYGMADALEQYNTEDKNVFCVVGLAHVVGAEGLVKLMEQKGYTVEKIQYK